MIYIVLGCVLLCVIATPKLTQLYARHLIDQNYKNLSTKLNAMESNKNID